MLITSRANERVKQVRALRDRKERDRSGVFFAEGLRVLRAALDAAAPIELLVTAPDRLDEQEARLADQIAAKAPVLEVSPEVFDSMSFREEGQSMGAVVVQRWEELSAVTETRRCWVALQDIQHPGNLGTLIRTCDAIGGDGVILSGQTTDPYHPVAVRGSLSAVFSQRIVHTTPPELTAWLPASGCRVYGTSPEGTLDYRDADYSGPVILIMGSERIGLSQAQIALCDDVLRIPMAGAVESLNLSIAGALVLYEVLRQQQRA